MKIYIVTDCNNGVIYGEEKEIKNLPLFLEKIKNTQRIKSNFTIYATYKNNCYDNILFKNKVA